MIYMGNFEEMERECLKQQTPEGQAALKVKRELLNKFQDINGITHLNAGEIQPLYDANSGKAIQYFIAL